MLSIFRLMISVLCLGFSLAEKSHPTNYEEFEDREEPTEFLRSAMTGGISSAAKALPTNYAEFEDRKYPNVASRATMTKACPQTTYVFPNREQNTNYIRVKTPVPDLDEFTVCGWYTRYTTSYDVLMSYATVKNSNAFFISQTASYIRIFLHGVGVTGEMNFATNREYHICVTTFTRTGYSYIFVNGQIEDVIHGSTVGVLPGGGVLVLGLDQDVTGGGFQAHESAQGKLSNYMLWTRALTVEEISTMSLNRCQCPDDYYITLQSNEVELEGGATALLPHKCTP